MDPDRDPRPPAGDVSHPAPLDRPLAPVPPARRIEVVDVLRGFALLGILVVNMGAYAAPLALQLSAVEWWSDPFHRAIERAIQFLAQGKFYTLFSFLFGLGLAIQLERARARGRPFAGFFARRMLWLLAIGLAHALLLWYGDILVLYALVGLIVILFRNLSPRALLVWAVGLFLVPVVLIALLTGLGSLAQLTEGGRQELQAIASDTETEMAASIERVREAYAHGSWGEIFGARLEELGIVWSYSAFFAPQVLALFLIGLAAGKLRVFEDLATWAPLLARWVPWLAAVGIVGNAIGVAALAAVENPAFPTPAGLLAQVGFAVGAPALCFFYVSAITLLARRPAWSRRFSPLAPLGRMALTNYVLQSVIATTLFYDYGLGWYGRVSPPRLLALALVIYALQIPLSVLWLRRFRFGPLEWLWRSLTYGRLQPLRRQEPSLPAGC